MKERPILFSGPMVLAILDGRKTQTRRVVKPQPSEEWAPIVEHYCPTKIARNGEEYPGAVVFGAADENEGRPCPYGEPGDRLWVRETWWTREPSSSTECAYRADGEMPSHMKGEKWRPSIHMPRWASRLTLEVVCVRVERVQEIRDSDAVEEGIQCGDGSWRHNSDGEAYMADTNGWYCGHFRHNAPQHAFRSLWDSINGKKPGRSWADNPWVWVLEFKRIEQDTTDWGAK